jgi:hypothetical protein
MRTLENIVARRLGDAVRLKKDGELQGWGASRGLIERVEGTPRKPGSGNWNTIE